MRLWDVETGKELRCIKVGDAVLGIAISPDGKEALGVVGYGVSAMVLWDLKSGKELRHFKGHKNTIGGLAFCPDGKRVVSGGYDKTVRVWDTTTGKELHCFTGHTERINSVAVSLDGRVALSASDDATVRLWQLSPKPASAKRAGGPKKK